MGERVGASRRQVFQAVAVAGVAAPVLAACGDDGGGDASGDDGGGSINCGCHGSKFSIEDGSVLAGPAGSPLKSESVSVEGDELTYSGSTLGPTSDIPVGGGKVFKDEEVVVTQPQAGTFKGFTAICTHERCIVRDVTA